MISNQILQNTIEGLKGISRIDFCVLDTEGKELAATFDASSDYSEAVLSFVESPADSQVIQGCQFFKIFDEQRLEYVLLADGESEDVYMLGKIAAFQIQSLLVAYKERFDKDNFIKNLLLDNLLLVDIYNRAKKLHIDTEVKRVIFIIETSHEKDNAALENVRSLLGGRSKDFITAVDEKNIIVVKELTDKEGGEYSAETAGNDHRKTVQRPAQLCIDTVLRDHDGRTGDHDAREAVEEHDVLALEVDDILCVIAENAGRLILFQHNGSTVHIDLQRILFRDVQGAAQLNGQHDPPQLIHFTHDSSRFHTSRSFLLGCFPIFPQCPRN